MAVHQLSGGHSSGDTKSRLHVPENPRDSVGATGAVNDEVVLS